MNNLKRKKIVISVSIFDDVLADLDKLAKKYNKRRPEILDELLKSALERIKNGGER